MGGRRVAEPTPGRGREVDDGRLTSEQQLGLKQAEERLRRDYIHRLVKVRNGHIFSKCDITPNIEFSKVKHQSPVMFPYCVCEGVFRGGGCIM